jgi:hypothetical protein
MSSTYSPSLRIELIGAGEQAGTWNTTTNTNLGTLLETAIAGNVIVSIDSASQALTANNGAYDQARQAVLTLTNTTGADFAVYAPPQPKEYIIYNTTAYNAIIYNSTVLGNTTAAGAGVTIPAGKKVAIFSDATNFYVLDAISLPTPGVLSVVNGGTGVTTSTGAGSTVLSNSPALVAPNLGTPTVLVGTNITGTAAGLSIGGNAATATTTSVATSATYAQSISTGAGWSVSQSGSNLIFAYGGLNKARLDSAGNLTVTGNVTAYGAI